MARPKRDVSNTSTSTHLVDESAVRDAADAAAVVGKQVSAVAQMLGVDLPNYTLPVLEDFARLQVNVGCEAMLKLGAVLLIIKEKEPHGSFLESIARIGVEPRSAQRMMQSAVKFSLPGGQKLLEANATTSTHLSKSKIFELVAFDDEELSELAAGGTVDGITLDDVSAMSVSELRLALREARSEGEAKDKVISEKSAKIDKLTIERKKGKVKITEGAEASAQLIADIGAILAEAHKTITAFVDSLKSIAEQAALDGFDEAAVKRAAGQTVVEINTRLAQSARDFELPISIERQNGDSEVWPGRDKR